jgi:hypothetical protein
MSKKIIKVDEKKNDAHVIRKKKLSKDSYEQ